MGTLAPRCFRQYLCGVDSRQFQGPILAKPILWSVYYMVIICYCMVSIPLIDQFTVIICNPIYEPWSSYKDVADFSNNNASSS